MSETAVLSQYLLVKFTQTFTEASPAQRNEWKEQILRSLTDAVDRFYIYQVFPAMAEADVLFWLTSKIDDKQTAPARFFERLARCLNPYRMIFTVSRVFWGYTRPSIYAKGKSSQEINPYADKRKKYLIVYPFSKTAEWYLLSRETRQGMMNEHIRVGRQHPEILQLLLYSFGLQDQEFIVSYETDNLFEFSELVNELRSTQARLYTLLDTPIITAIYHPPGETLDLFG